MSLFANTGLPGAGKTELLTYRALKHYRTTNSFLRRYFRRKRGEEEYINEVYSDYPILLDEKRNVYSRIIDIDDLDNSYRLKENAFVALDEPQLDYDSLDTTSFPRAIGMFMQAHRHFDICSIAFATQHPNRLIVYEKNIMSEYYYVKRAITLPFLPWRILIMRKVYELTDYDSINTRDREEMQRKNIYSCWRIYNYKKVHRAYDSKYLAPLNSSKPLLDKGFYTSLKLPPEALKKYQKKFEKYAVKRDAAERPGDNGPQDSSGAIDNFANIFRK